MLGILPLIFLATALILSVGLLGKYSENIRESSPEAALMLEDSLYDSYYQESKYFREQILRDHLTRTREML